MNLKDFHITIIIPCFNEKDNVEYIYNEIKKEIKSLELDYTFIFIDDGSLDNTWEIINSLKNNDKKIKGLKFSRNFGHPSALKAGIDHASLDTNFVLIIDADLQDPPSLISKMINKLIAEKSNTVFARRNKSEEKFFKRITSKLFYKLFNKLSYVNIPENTSDFRIFDNKILKELRKLGDSDIFFRGIIPWIGFKSSEVRFNRENRKYGQTGWTSKKMINFAIDGFFNFSSSPMRLTFLLSYFFSFLFFVFLFYILYKYFNNETIRGWTSLIMIISFSNSIILFVLGLISEYMGRLYQESKNRPSYIIDEIV